MTPAITAFFLGGTISMAGDEDGVVARYSAEDLVAAVPQLAAMDVALEVRNFRSLPSAFLGFADVLALVQEAEACQADGIVVVQGTDTIEETSYLIDLLWPDDVPIVLTGAMRNPALPGPDGPANLCAAVQVAASREFRGLGALVVFNDQVHAARHVRKTHSTSTATFASPNAGPIGLVIESRSVRVMSLDRRPVHRTARTPDARVPVHLVTLDDDGLGEGLADRCDGLVVAGFGAGHVPEQLAHTLVDLTATMPVVLASRTGAGPVLTHTYGFVGSETYLLERGLIGAGLLDPYKARVLLKVALACDYSPEQVRAAFADAAGTT